MLETENDDDDDATRDAYTFITTLGRKLQGCQVPGSGYLLDVYRDVKKGW